MVVKKLPYKNIAGVTPCPGGWLVLPARLSGITVAAEEAFVLKKLFEVLDFRPTFEAAAINAPMGLFDMPSGQYRPCDREAREYVGWPRMVAINGTPCRDAISGSNGEAQQMEPWMTKHDLRARPIFHHDKDAIQAHLTVVFAALAISRDLQQRTGVTIKKLVQTLRVARSATIEVNGRRMTLDPQLTEPARAILDHLQPGH